MEEKKEPHVIEKPDEIVLDKETLLKASDLLKQPREILAGAFFDVVEPLTIKQAKKKVKDFLERPITQEGSK